MSYVGDSNSYVGDSKSYVGVSNSYVADNKSYVGVSNTYVGDKSYVGLTFSYKDASNRITMRRKTMLVIFLSIK